jgi:hypothetical protein
VLFLHGEKRMLKSCKYCGRIHDSRYVCREAPAGFKKRTDKDRFRSSAKWQRKAEEIKSRDHYMCQVCFRNLYDTKRRINHERISVHHAIPLEKDFEKRLDDDNLLTMCSFHHEKAESGEIPYEKIKEIIDEQENTAPG